MSIEVWVAFVVASSVLLAVPGPTVMLVVSYALGRGKQTGWATVPGVAFGDFTAMTTSLLGAGAVLATSATLFTLLKLAGAAYLIWLGIGLWRTEPKLTGLDETNSNANSKSMFWNAYIVTALNPKSIVFFVAFVTTYPNGETTVPKATTSSPSTISTTDASPRWVTGEKAASVASPLVR